MQLGFLFSRCFLCTSFSVSATIECNPAWFYQGVNITSIRSICSLIRWSIGGTKALMGALIQPEPYFTGAHRRSHAVRTSFLRTYPFVQAPNVWFKKNIYQIYFGKKIWRPCLVGTNPQHAQEWFSKMWRFAGNPTFRGVQRAEAFCLPSSDYFHVCKPN